MSDLNQNQLIFCELYLTYGNATKAARGAGYAVENAGQSGYQLLQNPEIQKYLEVRRAEIIKGVNVSRERIMQEYMRLATYNGKDFFNDDDTPRAISDLTVDAAAAITAIEFDRVKKEDGSFQVVVQKLKMANKIDALSALSKMAGFAQPEDPLKAKVILTIDQIEILDANPDANKATAANTSTLPPEGLISDPKP